MKKRLIILLLLAVLVVSMTAFVACDQPETPPVTTDDEVYMPVYVKFDGVNTVSWTRVDPTAVYDEIDINGTVIKVEGTSFDLTQCDVKPADRVFTVKVRSVRTAELVSEWTFPHRCVCTAQLDAPVLTVKDGIISWDGNQYAKSINLSVNGEAVEYQLDKTVDISNVEGNVRIVAYYVGDGIVFANSNKISLEYDAELDQTRSLPVSNVKVSGLLLTFMGNIGTDEYHLTDTAGNVIISESSAYRMDNKLLIVSIRAYSKNYGYSTPVTVNYFTEGDGTKENPYKISKASDLLKLGVQRPYARAGQRKRRLPFRRP